MQTYSMHHMQSSNLPTLNTIILQGLAEYYSNTDLCCALDACRDPVRWVSSVLGFEVQSLPVQRQNMQFVEIRRRWDIARGQASETMLLLCPEQGYVMESLASEGWDSVQLCQFLDDCRKSSARLTPHYAHESSIYACPPCELDFNHHETFRQHLRCHSRDMMTVWVSPFLNNTCFDSADDYDDHLVTYFEERHLQGVPLPLVKDEWCQDRVVQNLLWCRKLANPVLEHLKWICRAKYATSQEWLRWPASHADIIILCLQYGIQEHAKEDFIDFVCLLVCKARRAVQREQGLEPDFVAPSLSFMARPHGSDPTRENPFNFNSTTASVIHAMLNDPSSEASRQGIFRSFCPRLKAPELDADMSFPEHRIRGDPNLFFNYLPPSPELSPAAMMAANDMYNGIMSTLQHA